MDPVGSPMSTSELQALIAAIPNDVNFTPSIATSRTDSSSIGDLSVASSSCIFPHMASEINALSSMLSLSAGYPNLFNGFPLLSPLQYLNGPLPPHSTIESLGLINSALYQQQRDIQSAMCSPSQLPAGVADTRPRAFSSAATLQHSKPPQESDKRRKRCRKMPESNMNTTTTITCTTDSATSTASSITSTTSVLRSLVEDDDEELTHYPNKVRPIHVTKEEEELVRRETVQLLKSVPIRKVDASGKQSSGPLRQLIRDEDLPDEVGPDSPFRHYPKYQRQSPSQLVMIQGIQAAVAALCIEAFENDEKTKSEEEETRNLTKNHRKSLDDSVSEAIRQELVAAE